MSLRHFFRVSWEKVIILVFLGFFYYLFSFLLEFTLLDHVNKLGYFFVLGVLLFFNPFFFVASYLDEPISLFFGLIFSGVIYWYFLTCVIDEIVFRDKRKNIRFFYG